jgi:hypothetical protein
MIEILISLLKIFGNIHGHTSYSDGCGTPCEAYEFVKSKNIKIYGITDHSHLLSQNEWENIIFCSNIYNDENFVALIGQEVGKLNYFGHINVYGENLNKIIPENCFYNLDSLYEYIKNKNLIGIFNHPSENNFENLKFREEYKDYICGIEIINKDSTYENRCLKALLNGWELCFIASQDNHTCLWGIEKNKNGRVPLTSFLIDSLSRKGIFESLRKRRTYAFELFPEDDTIYVDFKIDDNYERKIVKNINEINVSLKAKAKIPFFKIFLYIDKEIDSMCLYSNNIDFEKKYYLQKGKHFLFLKILQSDFDKCYVSPFFIEIKDEKIIYPEIIRKGDLSEFKILKIDGRVSKKTRSGILFLKKDKNIEKIIFIE